MSCACVQQWCEGKRGRKGGQGGGGLLNWKKTAHTHVAKYGTFRLAMKNDSGTLTFPTHRWQESKVFLFSTQPPASTSKMKGSSANVPCWRFFIVNGMFVRIWLDMGACRHTPWCQWLVPFIVNFHGRTGADFTTTKKMTQTLPNPNITQSNYLALLCLLRIQWNVPAHPIGIEFMEYFWDTSRLFFLHDEFGQPPSSVNFALFNFRSPNECRVFGMLPKLLCFQWWEYVAIKGHPRCGWQSVADRIAFPTIILCWTIPPMFVQVKSDPIDRFQHRTRMDGEWLALREL